MAPDKQPDLWWAFMPLLISKVVQKADGLSTKQVLLIAGGVISGLAAIIVLLLQFGFSSMQMTLSEIKGGQTQMVAKFDGFREEQFKRDNEQDKCLSELKTFMHQAHPARSGNGGGDFGDGKR